MSRRRTSRLKNGLNIYRLAVLTLGSAVFTAAAILRYVRRDDYLDNSLLYLSIIAAVWLFETVCAVLQCVLLPNVHEAKLRNHDRGYSKRPYDCILLALRRLEDGDGDGALAALARVDASRLGKRARGHCAMLSELAEDPERGAPEYRDALRKLSSAVYRDIDKLESRRRLLGSLPLAAVLTLFLIALMYFDQPEFPARCVEINSSIGVRSGPGEERYSLNIVTEASRNGADEYAVELTYQCTAEERSDRAGENSFFVQSPAPGRNDADRTVYIPTRLKSPDEFDLSLPDTVGFDRLYSALERAISGVDGTEGKYENTDCTVYQAQLPVKRLGAFLSYQFMLCSDEPYVKQLAWGKGLGRASSLGAKLQEAGAEPLPAKVWADSSGDILGAEIDTSSILPLLLDGSGLSSSAGGGTVFKISFSKYDPGRISPPEL